MAYARIENGLVAEYPLYAGDIKLQFPNTSFPKDFVPPEGYVEVVAVTPPQINWNQNIADGTPELIDGVWTQNWVVTDATPEQIAERTASQAASVRNDRNRRLADCDWTQLPDAPVDPAVWAAYRQALRDVTAQAGFPWDVQWPSEPGSN